MKGVYPSGSAGFFSQQKDDSLSEIKDQVMLGLSGKTGLLKYDQYRSYYYNEGKSPDAYTIERIRKLIFAEAGDWTFFYELTDAGPFLVGVRLSKWDEEHFGFKMANLQIFSVPEHSHTKPSLKKLLANAVGYLKEQGVAYITARVNGDHIVALHAMEDTGFRYYDNVVWPITSVKHVADETKVRLMKPSEINDVKRIAENFQYQRGHYYCDERFDKKRVDAMYPKWIDTTVKNNEPIAVLERDQQVAGLFVFRIDEELSAYTGYKYGRLKLLALDPVFRGTGAGSELFKGTLSLIKGMGADYIDSGYSTKNHISAGLHTKSAFLSVYEEVTFHYWIS